MRALKLKNGMGAIEHEDDLRLTFGSKSSIKELYLRGNMVKVSVSLFTKKISEIPKEINIIAAFQSTVEDVDFCNKDSLSMLRLLEAKLLRVRVDGREVRKFACRNGHRQDVHQQQRTTSHQHAASVQVYDLLRNTQAARRIDIDHFW